MRASVQSIYGSDVHVDTYVPKDPGNDGVWIRLSSDRPMSQARSLSMSSCAPHRGQGGVIAEVCPVLSGR